MKNSSSPDASLSRRTFLAISAAIPAAIAAQVPVSGSAAEPATPKPAGAKSYPIGLELYSVRGELARDLPNTLKTVAKLGYEVVDGFSVLGSLNSTKRKKGLNGVAALLKHP